MSALAARRWRVLVHALDRTGPPMLALALVGWLAEHRPQDQVEVLAFRGGELAAELPAKVTCHVVFEVGEPWHGRPLEGDELATQAARFADLEPVDVNLLVSISASLGLPLLPPDAGPVVAWVVEVGEDLHWFDQPVGLVARTQHWWVGSEASRAEVAAHLGTEVGVALVQEYVATPTAITEGERLARRAAMGASPGDGSVLLVGAGIGTHRKGMDLFLEVVALLVRAGHPVRACWFGGQDGPLFAGVVAARERLGLDDAVLLLPSVPDLDAYLAAADLMVHPARADAFPLVCASAAAAGTPVVAFQDVGGLVEMLGDDLVGATYPDVAALADRVVELLDPSRRQALALAQRQRAQAHLAPVRIPALVDVAAAQLGWAS